MKNSNLDNLFVTELTEKDLVNIQGGGSWLSRVWDATVGYVIGEVIDGVLRGITAQCPPKECPPNKQ